MSDPDLKRQATLPLYRAELETMRGLPGSPRVRVLRRVPPPTVDELHRNRNGPRRPA